MHYGSSCGSNNGANKNFDMIIRIMMNSIVYMHMNPLITMYILHFYDRCPCDRVPCSSSLHFPLLIFEFFLSIDPTSLYGFVLRYPVDYEEDVEILMDKSDLIAEI